MDILEQIVALGDQEQHTHGYRKKGGFAYTKVTGPITADVLAAHLNSTAPAGMYLMPDGKASQILVFDFDDHDKKGIAKLPTVEVAMTLERQGIPYLLFKSGGGWGYHIWLVFDKPHSKDALWAMATEVLNAVDDHAKYVPVASGSLNNQKFDTRGKKTHIEHGVEILPKGDGKQNVAIPCSRASVPMRLVRDGVTVDLEECTLDDLELVFVPVPEHQVAADDMGDTNREAAYAAFIQNFDPDVRNQWGAAALALIAAFGKDDEWARDKWEEWMKPSPAYCDGDENEWDGAKPKKYSPLSFWRIATRHGYRGPWPGKGVSEGAVSDFNDEWALMNVEGKVEFLNTATGYVSNVDSFYLLTKPDEEVRNKWFKSSNRRSYSGYTFAAPDYDGDKWNLFRGWPVEAEEGDASLLEKYVVEILCDGDKDLAHWVMTFVADAVQQPWSPTPTTGLAIRGPQGSGKSFLGKCVSAAIGELALEVTDSDRVTQQFNDLLAGRTVLLCDEAFFTGSHKLASKLKNLITSATNTFEPKGRKSFTTPNILRVIATTNMSHAVSIDNDDRRWTIIESKTKCPHQPLTKESRDWWAPYYDLINNRPGVVLRYFLDYKVDKDLIGLPYYTAAKAEDKLSSDPLLQLLVHMVETGTCPDDLRGDGRVSSGSLYREVKSLGGVQWTAAQALSNDLRKRFGATSAGNCIRINRVQMIRDTSGLIEVVADKRTDMPGLQMPPLAELRATVSAITGQKHVGPATWQPFALPTPESVKVDPNGGDAAAVEQWAMDRGEVVKYDAPF